MKRLITLSIFMLSASFLFSQNKLTGTVTDKSDSKPIKAVSVYIPDLKLGAITDADGKYEIKNIPNGTFLAVASFMGYTSQAKEVNVKETATADFTLEHRAPNSKK